MCTDLGRSLELLGVLLLTTPFTQHALPGWVILRMCGLVGKIDDLVSQAFAVPCQDVERTEIAKRRLQDRGDEGMRKLPMQKRYGEHHTGFEMRRTP